MERQQVEEFRLERMFGQGLFLADSIEVDA